MDNLETGQIDSMHSSVITPILIVIISLLVTNLNSSTVQEIIVNWVTTADWPVHTADANLSSPDFCQAQNAPKPVFAAPPRTPSGSLRRSKIPLAGYTEVIQLFIPLLLDALGVSNSALRAPRFSTPNISCPFTPMFLGGSRPCYQSVRSV